MLQSEAGYIDARPLTTRSTKLLQRTAGPYIRVKRRNTQTEHSSSELPRRADIRTLSPYRSRAIRTVVTPRPLMAFNPHKFRQPDNLSAMVGVIESISSGTSLAENVGLCWSRWHLANGSDRATITKNQAAIRLRWAAPARSKAAESFVGCDAFDQRHKLALHRLAFYRGIGPQQPQAESAVHEQQALDLTLAIARAFSQTVIILSRDLRRCLQRHPVWSGAPSFATDR